MRDVPACNDYQGGFNAALMSKDLRLAMQLAISCKQPFPMGEGAARLYQQVGERPLLALLLLLLLVVVVVVV
jgi:3-hydroxyisobutyrate dehydrogenase-like beta-hydroxyacid dehydrogenase